MRIASLLTAYLAVFSTAALAEPLDAAAFQGQVDALAAPLIEHRRVVGMSIGVIRGDEMATFNYGEARLGSGVPPTERTVYEIGSITKTFTGTLLARAVLSGEMMLDDPAAKYLPQGVKMPQFEDKIITLKHLSTHWSGLPRMPSNFSPRDRRDPYSDYTIERLHDFLNEHKMRRAPGAEYEYSNLAAGLLGTLLARQAGTTYEQLVREGITGPLGMDDTRLELTGAMQLRVATPYNANLDETHTWKITSLAGAGGLRSNVADMLKYLQATLQGEAGPLGGAAAMATQPHADGNGPRRKMGLGWHIGADGLTRVHNGQTGGYHTYAAVNPDKNIGVIILANTATPIIDALGDRILITLAGGDAKPIELSDSKR